VRGLQCEGGELWTVDGKEGAVVRRLRTGESGERQQSH
jgi:hypothetical protein